MRSADSNGVLSGDQPDCRGFGTANSAFCHCVVETPTSTGVCAQRLKEVQRIARFGCWTWEPATNKVWWSEATHDLFGTDPAAVTPSYDAFLRLVHPDDRWKVQTSVEALLAGAEFYGNDLRLVRPTGECIWLHSRARASRGADGQIVIVEGIDQDINDRKRAEEQLQQTLQLLQAVSSGTTDAIFVKDRDGKYLFANEATARFLGKPVEEIVGHDDTVLFDGASAAIVRREDLTAQSNIEVQTHEETLTVNGITRTFLATKGPYRDEAGHVIGVIGISRDITSRKATERDLKLKQFSIDHLLDSVLWIDAQFRFINVNETACQVLGYSAHELMKLSVWDIDPNFPPEKCDFLMECLRENGSITIESLHVTKSGKRIDVEITGNHLLFEGQEIVCVIARDIVARKRTEKLISAQHAVVKILADSIDMHEAAPQLLRAICQKADWDVGEFWVRNPERDTLQLISAWHAPDMPNGKLLELASTTQLGRGEDLAGQAWLTTRTEWFPEIEHERRFFRAQEARRMGLRGAVAFPILFANEVMAVVTLLCRHTSTYDDDMSQLFDHIGIQIGQFMERKMVEDQVRESQKMEAIGRLAGGIAHDFNNLLTVINCHADLLRLADNNPESVREHVRSIQHAGSRAAELTAQLLTFSRKSTVATRTVDLNETVQAAARMLTHLIRKDIAVELSLDPALANIKADPGQVERVVMNLAVNARDAMPAGGRLRFSTYNSRFDRDMLSRLRSSSQTESFVCLEVTDTGHGMDEEIKRKIFEPFFTTKEVGQGTGLGLAVVHGIMKQCGGNISVESVLHVGTTFRLLFPATFDSLAADGQNDQSIDSVRRSDITVLVVDDEIAIQHVIRTLLESHGFRVLLANCGTEALRIVNDSLVPIDILVSDLIMPEMGGRELAKELQARHPGIKTILMSGYSTPELSPRDTSDLNCKFLNKPFAPGLLLETIRNCVGTSHAER